RSAAPPRRQHAQLHPHAGGLAPEPPALLPEALRPLGDGLAVAGDQAARVGGMDQDRPPPAGQERAQGRARLPAAGVPGAVGVKVCFLTSNSPPEIQAGTEMVAQALGEALVAAGHEVLVVSTSERLHAGTDV